VKNWCGLKNLGEKVRKSKLRMTAMMLMLINFNNDCGIIVEIY